MADGHDRKSPALKELQGYIWEEGYRSRVSSSRRCIPTSRRAFERWCADGKRSASSRPAACSRSGGCFAARPPAISRRHLQWYFDTHTGAKQDARSYERIAAEDAITPPADILFISDVVAELDAARAAGMRTVLALRPGNHPQPTTIIARSQFRRVDWLRP